MILDSSLIDSFHSIFKTAKKLVITNHMNPDGDAMGSALGLAGVLQKRGFEVQVIVPNPYPSFLYWMGGNQKVMVYDNNIEDCNTIIQESDLIIHLDYNALHRSGSMQEILESSKAKKMMIDHHQQPDDFPDATYSDTSMSSTCEMVFHLVKALGWEDDISKMEADCLYTGIVTDTGGFRFGSTSPITHQVAASLLGKGVLPQEIASRVYDTNSPERLKLLSKALENMELLPELNAAIIHLSKSELQEFNFKKGDTEGFVNYGLSIQGVKLSIFMAEKDGLIKMSFRSKGNFDVNQVARKYFNGGGHINAAGGATSDSLEDTIKRVKDVLPEYKSELEND